MACLFQDLLFKAVANLITKKLFSKKLESKEFSKPVSGNRGMSSHALLLMVQPVSNKAFTCISSHPL